MQKLEQVLHAEEAARRVVADAHEKADTTVRSAEAEARSIVEDARRDAATQADEIRSAALADASREASGIAEGSTTRLEEDLVSAKQRLQGAVAAAVEMLAE